MAGKNKNPNTIGTPVNISHNPNTGPSSELTEEQDEFRYIIKIKNDKYGPIKRMHILMADSRPSRLNEY